MPCIVPYPTVPYLTVPRRAVPLQAALYDFYGISPDFPLRAQLLIRSLDSLQPKRLYFVVGPAKRMEWNNIVNDNGIIRRCRSYGSMSMAAAAATASTPMQLAPRRWVSLRGPGLLAFPLVNLRLLGFLLPPPPPPTPPPLSRSLPRLVQSGGLLRLLLNDGRESMKVVATGLKVRARTEGVNE
jgi:hypothetical protein